MGMMSDVALDMYLAQIGTFFACELRDKQDDAFANETYRLFCAVREHIYTMMKNSEWISVKDKLPEQGKNVLVYIERNAYRFDEIIRKREIAIGWHMEGRWHVDGCSGVVGLYWQELPEPPKEVSE